MTNKNEWFQKVANLLHRYIAKDKHLDIYAYVSKPTVNKTTESWNSKGDFLRLDKSMFPGMPELVGEWDKTLIEPQN